MDIQLTRVMVVDDHPIVRQGLRSLLSQYPDIQVVGEADGGPATMEMIASLRPNVVLLDIRLAEVNGLDLARLLRDSQPDVRVIILTSYDDEAYLLEAAQAGMHGYLLKSASAELLADAIRAVHAGERRLSPALVSKALEQLEALSRAQAQAESGLSDQELQLLRLLADGATSREMAQTLYLSERTVKRKIQDILTKLGAASRPQAVAHAFKRGLLDAAERKSGLSPKPERRGAEAAEPAADEERLPQAHRHFQEDFPAEGDLDDVPGSGTPGSGRPHPSRPIEDDPKREAK